MAQKREESLVKMGIASRSLVTDKDGEAVCRALRAACRIARLGPSTLYGHGQGLAGEAPQPNPYRARRTAGALTFRDFVPWRFSDAGRINVEWARYAGVRKPAQFRTYVDRSDIGWWECH